MKSSTACGVDKMTRKAHMREDEIHALLAETLHESA